MYVEGDVPSYVGTNGNCNNNADGFGGWWGIIALVAVAAIFGGGWGVGGFGGNGGGALTRADLCSEFNFNGVESGIRGIQQGICDSTYALNNAITGGFAGVQQTLCQGFNGVNTSVLTSTNSLSAQLADCCCTLSRGQERISCDIERSTNATIQAANANTQRILDYLCNEKISALQAENSLLTSQLSQNSQTQTLLNAINRTPSPAFVVPNPYTGAYGGYGYGNSGCGCGCGCNG